MRKAGKILTVKLPALHAAVMVLMRRRRSA
jgi:hypothetical protein